MRITYTQIQSLCWIILWLWCQQDRALAFYHPHLASCRLCLCHITRFSVLLLWEFWHQEVTCGRCACQKDTLWYSVWNQPVLSCVFAIDPCCFEEANKESLLSVCYYASFSRLCLFRWSWVELRRLHLFWVHFWPLRRVYIMNKGGKFHICVDCFSIFNSAYNLNYMKITKIILSCNKPIYLVPLPEVHTYLDNTIIYSPLELFDWCAELVLSEKKKKGIYWIIKDYDNN